MSMIFFLSFFFNEKKMKFLNVASEETVRLPKVTKFIIWGLSLNVLWKFDESLM